MGSTYRTASCSNVWSQHLYARAIWCIHPLACYKQRSTIGTHSSKYRWRRKGSYTKGDLDGTAIAFKSEAIQTEEGCLNRHRQTHVFDSSWGKTQNWCALSTLWWWTLFSLMLSIWWWTSLDEYMSVNYVSRFFGKRPGHSPQSFGNPRLYSLIHDAKPVTSRLCPCAYYRKACRVWR